MIPVPAILGLAGGFTLLYLLSSSKSHSGEEVTVNGRKWILEKTGSNTIQRATQGGMTNLVETSFLVYAPERAYGPHGLMPVVAFSQLSDNPATRKWTASYPGVPPLVWQMAVGDFNIKNTPSVVSGRRAR